MAAREVKRSTSQVGLILSSISERTIRDQKVKLAKVIRGQKLALVNVVNFATLLHAELSELNHKW